MTGFAHDGPPSIRNAEVEGSIPFRSTEGLLITASS